MTATRTASGRPRGRSRMPLVAAIVLFVLLDALLIGLAVFFTTTPSSTVTAPVPSVTARPTEPGTPVPAVAEPVVQAQTRLLSAYDDSTAWRTTIGECPSSRAVIERTTNGGNTWNGYNLGATGGVSSAITLRSIVDANSVVAVALTSSACNASWLATYTGGADWASYSDRLATAWYVMPSDRSVVYALGVTRNAPCREVHQLSNIDDEAAAVLCSDGMLYRTTDAGSTWDDGVSAGGAVALAQSPSGYLLARPDAPGCSGTGVLRFGISSAVSDAQMTSCAPVASSDQPTALAASNSSLWLWVGDRVLRSIDSGSTWN